MPSKVDLFFAFLRGKTKESVNNAHEKLGSCLSIFGHEEDLSWLKRQLLSAIRLLLCAIRLKRSPQKRSIRGLPTAP